ncbi:hypothetical protein V1511DRAFT_496017 [Dipodascopsis uninucleata]
MKRVWRCYLPFAYNRKRIVAWNCKGTLDQVRQRQGTISLGASILLFRYFSSMNTIASRQESCNLQFTDLKDILYEDAGRQRLVDSSRRNPKGLRDSTDLGVRDTDSFLRSASAEEILDFLNKNIHRQERASSYASREVIWKSLAFVYTDAPRNISKNLFSSIESRIFERLFYVALKEPSEKERNRAIVIVGDFFYASVGSGVSHVEPHLKIRILSEYILALAYENRLDRALELWEERKAQGTDMYDQAWWWEIGIKLYASRNHIDTAFKVANNVQIRFGKISDYAYTVLFVQLCKVGQIKMAKRIYMDMFSKYISGTTDIDFDTGEVRRKKILRRLLQCIRAAFDAGDSSLGFLILRDFEDIGGKFGTNQAIMLMDHLTNEEVKKQLEEVSSDKSKRMRITESEKKKIEAIIKVCLSKFSDAFDEAEFYRIWLDRLCRLGLTEYMAEVFNEMVKKGIKASSFHTQAMLRGLLLSKQYKAADNFLRVMEEVRILELQDESIENYTIGPPIANHYALFVQYHLRRRQKDKVNTILKRMKELEIFPNTVLINALLTDAFHEKDYRKMWSTLDIIRSSNQKIQPDTVTYSLIWRSLYRLHRHLIALSLKIEKYPTVDRRREAALKNMEKLARQTPDARKLLREMVSNNQWNPNAAIASYILRALIFMDDISATLCVIELFGHSYKLRPTTDVLSAVVQSLAFLILRPVLGKQGKENFQSALDYQHNTLNEKMCQLPENSSQTSLQKTILADFKELSYRNGREADELDWLDISSLISYWVLRDFSEADRQVFYNDFLKFRKELGFSHSQPRYFDIDKIR